MTSPSSAQLRRSTPCVAGWWGPRLTVNSSVVGSAVSSLIPARHLMLVEGEDHRLATHREVAPLRVTHVVVGHEQAAHVRVAVEDDAEHVEDLALLEVGGREEVDDRGDLLAVAHAE